MHTLSHISFYANKPMQVQHCRNSYHKVPLCVAVLPPSMSLCLHTCAHITTLSCNLKKMRQTVMNCHQNVIWLERLPKLSELPRAARTDTAAITAADSQCHQQVRGRGGCLRRQLCSSSLTVAAFVLQNKPNFWSHFPSALLQSARAKTH